MIETEPIQSFLAQLRGVLSHQFLDFLIELLQVEPLATVQDGDERQRLQVQLLLLARLGENLEQLPANLLLQLRVRKKTQ